MSGSLGTFILIGLAVFFLITSIKIAKEEQRFAVFTLGKFAGFKGPGLLFKLLGAESKWVSISMGDRMELITPNMAKFGNFVLPVETEGKVPLNSMVRVIGFKDNTTILTMLDSSQYRKIKCEKCGHEMNI